MQENITTQIQPKALPFSEAARYVGLSEGGLRWAIFNRRGPKSVRCGKRRLFRIEDLDSWLEENLEEAPHV